MTIPQFGKTGVYRLYDADGNLIYVGIGSDPESRFKDHAREKEWWPQVTRKTIVWRDSRDEALTEEFETIRDHSPIHNRAAWEPRVSNEPPSTSSIAHIPVRVMRGHVGRRVDEAYFRGEHTVIEKSGEPRAVLVPYEWWLAQDIPQEPDGN